MARVTNLMNIALSGKVGNLVLCNGPVRGSYTRALPKKTTARTEKQLSTQNKVKMANLFLSPLRPLIEEMWQKDRYTRKTAYGSAFSHLMKHAFRGGYAEEEIIYPEVVLCRGALIKPDGLMALREGSHIEITWAGVPTSGQEALPEDKAVLVICNESKGLSISFREKAVRSDGRIAADLPAVYEAGKLHAYLLFASRNGRYTSDSAYVAC